MSFKEINDYDLLNSNTLDSNSIYSILEEKYKAKLKKVNSIFAFLGYSDSDFDYVIRKTIIDTKNSFNKSKFPVSNNKNSRLKNIIGEQLDTIVNSLLMDVYRNSTKELSFDSFEEYVFMVAGKSDEQLYFEQMQAFNYLDRPIQDEFLQIYDSLTTLEGYLFDIESNEVMFTIEQRAVVERTIKRIRESLEDKDIELAKLRLVSLQMMMGLNVQFLPTLKYIIDNKVELRRYVEYNNGNNNKLDNGRGKHL